MATVNSLRLLTTVGAGDYAPTRYRLSDESGAADEWELETQFCSVSLAARFKPKEVVVFATQKAREKWLDGPEGTTAGSQLKSQLDQACPQVDLQVVNIPDGSSEDEIWQIFEVLTKALQPNDRIVLDITHGFRSLPLLLVLAAVFLRVAKRVKLEGIYYGAWESRDRDQNVSPVFNLTPFISLLDFAGATEFFLATGNAKLLADLLVRIIKPINQALPDKRLYDDLRTYSDSLVHFSTAYQLAQPLEVSQTAGKVKEFDSRSDFELISIEAHSISAYLLVLDRVRQAIEPLTTGDESVCTRDSLAAQYALIRTYIRHGQELHAITLAREWLVSLACYSAIVHHKQKVDWLNTKDRTQIGRDLMNMTNAKHSTVEIFVHYSEDIALQSLARCYENVCRLRNKTAHCGMMSSDDEDSEISLSNLIISIRKVCDGDLVTVAKQYDVEARRV